MTKIKTKPCTVDDMIKNLEYIRETHGGDTKVELSLDIRPSATDNSTLPLCQDAVTDDSIFYQIDYVKVEHDSEKCILTLANYPY